MYMVLKPAPCLRILNSVHIHTTFQGFFFWGGGGAVRGDNHVEIPGKLWSPISIFKFVYF